MNPTFDHLVEVHSTMCPCVHLSRRVECNGYVCGTHGCHNCLVYVMSSLCMLRTLTLPEQARLHGGQVRSSVRDEETWRHTRQKEQRKNSLGGTQECICSLQTMRGSLAVCQRGNVIDQERARHCQIR